MIRYRDCCAYLASALTVLIAGCNTSGTVVQQSGSALRLVERAQNHYSADLFSPPETLVASSVAIIGNPTDTGKRDPVGQPFYRVEVRKVLFNVTLRNLPSTITVLGSRILRMRDGRTVMLALSPSIRDAQSFQLTTRVSAIGVPRERDISFRAMTGELLTYPTVAQSSMGCFVAHVATDCRPAILSKFGIRSARQRNVYDALLRRSPSGGVMWIHAYRRTHMAFPNKLCSPKAAIRCASASAFFKTAQLEVTM